MSSDNDLVKEFEELQSDAAPSKKNDKMEEEFEEKFRKLEFILDIPLQVRVELGRSKMLVNDFLRLGQGSVVELGKLAGDALEVFVNEKLVAKGEVVVVNERFGVRLTDIVSPVERIESMKWNIYIY